MAKRKVITYFIFILYLLFCAILYSKNIIDVNAFAIMIAMVACIATIVPLLYTILDDYAESKKEIKIEVVESREYDSDLMQDLIERINNLKQNGQKVDSIHIVETTGFIDKRKTVYIINH
ncbi:hypothetical protein [Clostridium tagluense]|uniref:hypothetical protein n=1 Tax=Clostridium tagluense TaxID=360422 RepID=UPI001C0C6D36|nr:hypothetical protein [Clostridium tagluense]MBU3126756.1 hypothetical protein [Clostridium tagluense]